MQKCTTHVQAPSGMSVCRHVGTSEICICKTRMGEAVGVQAGSNTCPIFISVSKLVERTFIINQCSLCEVKMQNEKMYTHFLFYMKILCT